MTDKKKSVKRKSGRDTATSIQSNLEAMTPAFRRILTLTLYACAATLPAAEATRFAEERAALAAMEISPQQLAPLQIETPLVENGAPCAVIRHPDDPAWLAVARDLQHCIADVTGATLPLRTETLADDPGTPHALLVGNLNNNRHVARLYHSYFICSDNGYTGTSGFEIRTVHAPIERGRNCIVLGGASVEGVRLGAEILIKRIKAEGRPGSLKLGRLLELSFDRKDCARQPPPPMDDALLAKTAAHARTLMLSPGQARSGVARLIDMGLLAHRYADPQALKAYRASMLALLEYYRNDEYINGAGMRRYDRDFRDSWTHDVAILFDALEESGVFSDAERLDLTNLIIRLALECVRYQGWDRPNSIAHWTANKAIVHNHNTFPALGVLFAGNYLKRQYASVFVDDWLKVAHGIFNGQKHTWKPLEDSAAYQWLPVIHTMMYSLSQDDLAYFSGGHARQAADAAIQVMDCAGNQAAFGDHSALKGASGIAAVLQMASWYYRDPGFLWGARLATSDHWSPIGQEYAPPMPPSPPERHVGLTSTPLTKATYDSVAGKAMYSCKPNLPFGETFDKLAFRGGWDRGDEYLLLDGFARGNHMHFDGNAIISFAKGGEPLLVDGEYIRNAPKYHNGLVILRDGQSEFCPAVAGLDRADNLATTAVSLTRMRDYNGADWNRTILWCRNDYFVVCDEVTAIRPGDFTLRCCWRPWGFARQNENRLLVEHPPMRLAIVNADGAEARLETLKHLDDMPVGRWSQQVSREMKAGESHRFINLFHAEPIKQARELHARRLADGLLLISKPEGNDLVAFGPGVARLPGIAAKGEMALFQEDRIVMAGATSLSAGSNIIMASSPISLEMSPTKGEGVIATPGPVEVSLSIRPNGRCKLDDREVIADANGHAPLRFPAGRHTFRFEPFPMHEGVLATINSSANSRPQPAAAQKIELGGLRLRKLWSHSDFDAPMEKLAVASCQAKPQPKAPYAPAMKLFDGKYNGSTTSAMWPRGATANIRADLREESEITKVVLREWAMNKTWETGERRLEISSDDFKNDIRVISAPFEKIGEESFGNNVNTLMAVPVKQKARQIRLACGAARPDSVVYLAEVEIHGARPETHPRITAMAAADLAGAKASNVIAATDQGQIVAIDRSGKRLWTFADTERGPIHSLACADISGDQRPEVIYGGSPARLGVLDAKGTRLWRATPPMYRGIKSDVMTVFAANVGADRRPEIIAGCRSWQYLAYDNAGKMIWKTVIYAHSATVGCAADFDDDGLDEILAGNEYYATQLLDSDGKQMWSSSGIGPEMTAVAQFPVRGGAKDIVFGVDSGELYCFNAHGKLRWRANAGDRVRRIAPADLDGDGNPEILCAAESASLFALDPAGKTIWRRGFADGASDLATSAGPSGPRIWAAAGKAGLILLDAQGNILAIGEVSGRAESLAVLANGVAVADSNASVTAFASP